MFLIFYVCFSKFGILSGFFIFRKPSIFVPLCHNIYLSLVAYGFIPASIIATIDPYLQDK